MVLLHLSSAEDRHSHQPIGRPGKHRRVNEKYQAFPYTGTQENAARGNAELLLIWISQYFSISRPRTFPNRILFSMATAVPLWVEEIERRLMENTI